MTPATATPCPIPYQGSKRKMVPAILRFLPADLARLHEPFAGSAAVALGVATTRPRVEIRLNDSNGALAALWSAIIEEPQPLADRYETLWMAQLDDPRAFYLDVRERFNATGAPELLLYLLARCVKAAVRYNGRGEFNQSADHRRLGSRPATLRRNVAEASAALRGRTAVSSLDFRAALACARAEDVAYLDPPYQGVSTASDRRYAAGVGYHELVEALATMNRRQLCYVLSYDGRTGDRCHGRPLPEALGLRRYEVDAGRSAQSTLSGGDARTVESLYLSPALAARLGRSPDGLVSGSAA